MAMAPDADAAPVGERATEEEQPPPIDPSLLAALSPSERAEALAAAAAAHRAERRAEERAAARRKEKEAAENGGGAGGAAEAEDGGLDEEEEAERRALAEATERRRREREREREAARSRTGMALPASTGLGGGAGGVVEGVRGGGGPLTFVSKKKRGASRMSISPESNDGERSRSPKRREGLRDPNKNVAAGNNGNIGNGGNREESHLTASQLASIKRAYLGDKAVNAADESYHPAGGGGGDSGGRRGHGGSRGNDPNDPNAVRRRLREQRQKRRVKKTTFKFAWGDEEDTFEEDDPLYGGVGGGEASGAPPHRGDGRRGHRPPPQGRRGGATGGGGIRPAPPPPAAGSDVKFGKKKSRVARDRVATVHTVATKPLSKMTPRDWRIFRENYDIVVKGGKSPPPMRSFREMPAGVPGIHPSVLDAIEKTLRYAEPSPIQRQAIPVGMQRRDLIGIAETGSGKTAAFGVPLCHHVLSFPPEVRDTVSEEGPLALVMAPTRELALQIDGEIRKLLSAQGDVVSLAVVGGQSITEQATKLRNGVHVVVGTPGRINDCVEMAYLVLNQCSYIVLDEADRMIDLGFAPQIEDILEAMGGKLKSEDETEAYRQEREDLERLGKAVPSHRLTAMFSATMPPEVERIARRYLRHPVVVSVGDRDSSKNARIVQRVVFLSSSGQKEGALKDLLRRSRPNEKIIVFVNEKKHADGVGRIVEQAGRQCVVLHGGKTQEHREENLALFRRGGMVLVATDVAGRGLDVPDVQQVVNYDLPTRSIDNYCHRIGRTGRAGKEGLATSFITDEDEGIMAPLRRYLETTGSPVPDRLARHPAASGSSGDFIR